CNNFTCFISLLNFLLLREYLMGFSVIVCVTQAKPSYLNFASRKSPSPGYYPLLNFDPPLIRICNSDLLQLPFVTADPDLQSGSHTISICNAFGPPLSFSVKTPAMGGQFYAAVRTQGGRIESTRCFKR